MQGKETMNMYTAIAMMAAMLFVTAVSAQSPSRTNSVWGVNDQNEVFRWNLSQSKFVRMPGISLKQVSVGTEGEVFGVDPDDNAYRWNGLLWEQLQGEKLRQLSVNLHEAWGVNASDDLFRWSGSAWENLYDGSSTLTYIAYVSLGVDGSKWAILHLPSSAGIPDTYTWISAIIPEWLEGHQQPVESRLPLLPNESLDSIDGHPKRIWVVDGNHGWAINDNAQLFQWSGGGWQQPFDGNYVDVAEGVNGQLWRLTSDGRILFNRAVSEPTQEMQPGFLLKQISVGATGASDTGLTYEERQQMLDAHNRERQDYPGVGALQWSPELERYAQEWAQAVASGDKSGHRPNTQNNPFRPGEGLGENMYLEGPIKGSTGVNAVEWFISEKQWYHYDQDNGGGPLGEPPGCSAPPLKACGHFTQVIWKNTQYVGCGTAISANDRKWYVCNYYPPGNWNRQKPY
jgi:pathogenesis-related protein 1